jgi:hypothetical protein
MSASRIDEIMAGVKACIAAVPGIVKVYTHQPPTIGTPPAVVLFLGPSRPIYPPEGVYGAMNLEWTILAHLVLNDVNTAKSETQIAQFIPAIIEALGHDIDAGGGLPEGELRVLRFTPGYYTVAGNRSHAVEFEIRAWETVEYTYSF